MTQARLGKPALVACTAMFLEVFSACASPHDRRYYDSAIEFQELDNLGYYCTDRVLGTWSVTNRGTSTQGEAACEQPILFPHLQSGVDYTFDIVGYDLGGRACWSGSCRVTASGFETTYADCARAIRHDCGL